MGTGGNQELGAGGAKKRKLEKAERWQLEGDEWSLVSGAVGARMGSEVVA